MKSLEGHLYTCTAKASCQVTWRRTCYSPCCNTVNFTVLPITKALVSYNIPTRPTCTCFITMQSTYILRGDTVSRWYQLPLYLVHLIATLGTCKIRKSPLEGNQCIQRGETKWEWRKKINCRGGARKYEDRHRRKAPWNCRYEC